MFTQQFICRLIPEPKPVKPPVISKPDVEDGPTQPVEPVEPVKPVEPVRPKKPAGAVSMFGGVDLFGGSKSPPFSVAAAKSRVPVKPKGSTVFLFLPLPNRETTNTSYIGLLELFLPQP